MFTVGTLFILCACEGICAVVKVVAPTEPLKLTEPLTDGVPNAFVNVAEPPAPAVPLTTLSALLLCAVDLTQPVGAEVCTNSILVPEGMDGLGDAIDCHDLSPRK